MDKPLKEKSKIFDFCKKLAVTWMKNENIGFVELLTGVSKQLEQKDVSIFSLSDNELMKYIEEYMEQFDR